MAFNLEETKKTARVAFRRTLWFSLLLGILALGAYYVYRTWEISDGTRSGRLFKISRKGAVIKTLEGQLHLGGSAMMSDQSVWDFSVQSNSVYEEMQKLEGKNVKCYYRQLNNPFPWQGDTQYLVYKVEELKE